MAIGIRAEGLRKVYTSPPPAAAAGRGAGFSLLARGKGPKQKYEVVALDDLSLEVAPGEIFVCSAPTARASRRRSGS